MFANQPFTENKAVINVKMVQIRYVAPYLSRDYTYQKIHPLGDTAFDEDKSNNVCREIRKCFRKTSRFEFFAKQIIYLESPDHPLQNDI